jgi:hypothetical protein
VHLQKRPKVNLIGFFCTPGPAVDLALVFFVIRLNELTSKGAQLGVGETRHAAVGAQGAVRCGMNFDGEWRIAHRGVGVLLGRRARKILMDG